MFWFNKSLHLFSLNASCNLPLYVFSRGGHAKIKNNSFQSFLFKKYTYFSYAIALFVVFTIPSLAFARCSLTPFMDNVLANNPTVKAAEANVLVAQAKMNAASYPIYNPELTGEFQNAIENTRSVGINQTFDWTNKRGAKKNISCANLQVAQAQLTVARLQVITQTLDALARYHATKRIVVLARKRSEILKDFLGVTNRRYKSGDIARVEVDLSQLALAEALAQQAGAEVSFNESLEVLRAVTGQYRTDWPTFPRKFPYLEIATIDVSQLTNTIPAVEVLHHQYISAIARIKLAERERYPDPTFGIEGGYQTESNERKNLIGLTLSIPLYILNPYKAEVEAANLEAMEASEKRADIFRQTRAAIVSSAERYRILYNAMKKWRQGSTKPLTNSAILIQKLWRAGEITTTEYLVQLKQRIDSQIAGADLQGRTWQAWVDWLKASGQAETWLHEKVCS